MAGGTFTTHPAGSDGSPEKASAISCARVPSTFALTRAAYSMKKDRIAQSVASSRDASAAEAEAEAEAEALVAVSLVALAGRTRARARARARLRQRREERIVVDRWLLIVDR